MVMILKLLFISVLVLAILFVTWVKDRENMNPPLKRRVVIDLTTIAIFWLLFIGFIVIGNGEYDKSITCNENGYINLFMMWLCLWIFMSLLREKFGALCGDIGKKKRRLSM